MEVYRQTTLINQENSLLTSSIDDEDRGRA